tara:strand:+ start:404 stop:949 length:546 start_codon:yes stop_codon:yes gene_type:complete
MKSFTEQAKRYASYHQSPLTWYTHMAGVPLILFSIMILLGFIHIVIPNVLEFSFADIFVIGLMVYYFRLQWLLAIIIAPILVFMLWLSLIISFTGPTEYALWFFAIVFLLGCIAQMAGHIIEGNKPAFFAHPKDSIATPLFILAELLFKAGWFTGLEEKIHGHESEAHSNEPNALKNKKGR